jgi:hypothetical protein
MKRDWDLIRVLLVELESSEGALCTRDVEGYSEEAVNYHMDLLIGAGLADGECRTGIGSSGTTCHLKKLTWAGHEFLDGIRSKSAWNAVKKIAQDKGLSLSFEVVKLAAAHVIKTMF